MSSSPLDPSHFHGTGAVSNGSPFWIPSAKNGTPIVFYSIALVVVALRLLACIRKSLAVFSDDILAAFGGTFSTVLLVVFVRLYKSNANYRYMFGGTPIQIGPNMFMVGNPDQPLVPPGWAWIMFHHAAIWATRTSFAYTIWRHAQTEKTNRISKYAFFAFVAGWVVSSIEAIFVCDKSPAGLNIVCTLPVARAVILGLLFDLAATGWLFVWAIVVVKPTLASKFHSTVMHVVQALQLSIIGVSIAYLAYKFQYKSPMVKLLWQIQAPLCVILYNLAVIALAFMPSRKAAPSPNTVYVGFDGARVEATEVEKVRVTRTSDVGSSKENA